MSAVVQAEFAPVEVRSQWRPVNAAWYRWQPRNLREVVWVGADRVHFRDGSDWAMRTQSGIEGYRPA